MSGLTQGVNRYIFGCMQNTASLFTIYVFLLNSVNGAIPDESVTPTNYLLYGITSATDAFQCNAVSLISPTSFLAAILRATTNGY